MSRGIGMRYRALDDSGKEGGPFFAAGYLVGTGIGKVLVAGVTTVGWVTRMVLRG
jgi:hypothetical protein